MVTFAVMKLNFSFIIPVYNRPNEIKELLESFEKMHYDNDYEIVIIEDGSTESSEEIIKSFTKGLNISYYKKPNSGPGDSRNYGMKKAKGNYFIILDSDCILPENYLQIVLNDLNENYVDCYGGPDAAHNSFSNLQKAINFSMTSFITTGGIRGGKRSLNSFQPRSFNMGISKKAFEASGGFGNIHPGEDPDLSLRLINHGFKTKLIPEALVYHKRRISWSKFYNQVFKFGLVRPILNYWHPKSAKITFWFPTLFLIGAIASIVLFILDIKVYLYIYLIYFIITFVVSSLVNKSLLVGILSVYATIVQFVGYGYGFFKSTFKLKVMQRNPEKEFPFLFFKTS